MDFTTKELYVVLEATKKCNRGCSHCSVNAINSDNRHLSVRHVDLLLNGIDKLGLSLTACVTGGGEPLLNPNIIELAKLIHSFPKLVLSSFVTSGFLEGEKNDRKQLEGVLEGTDSRQTKFNLSFNLYQPTFPQRLKTTLLFLLKQPNIVGISTLVRFSLDTFNDTLNEFHEILWDINEEGYPDIQIQEFMIDYTGRRFLDVIENDFFQAQYWGDDLYDYLSFEAFMQDTFFIAKSHRYGHKMIICCPDFITKNGRALRLKEDTYPYKGCRVIFGRDDGEARIELHLSVNGYFYPSCSCYNNPKMRLGHIERDSLKTIIRRKKELSQQLLGLMLSDARVPVKLCAACQEIKQTYFSF